MKKLLLIVGAAAILAGCATTPKVSSTTVSIGKLKIETGRPLDVKRDTSAGTVSLYPAEGSVWQLFDVPAKLDPNYLHVFNEAGMVLDGRLAVEFVLENNFATVSVPSGATISWGEDVNSYLLEFGTAVRATVASPQITYKIWEAVLFNEAHSFRGPADGSYPFTHNGKDILIIRNDNPVWRFDSGMDFDHFYLKFGTS